MIGTTLKVVVVVALLVEVAVCSSVDASRYEVHGRGGHSYDLSAARTFGVSNISLTITYVSLIVAIIMLAGFMWITFSFSATGKGSNSYERRGFDSQEWMFGGGRYRRSTKEMEDQDLAKKLVVLNDSFKKFDMENLGCQMLVSCEAAQLETAEHPIYGQLTPKIHKLLSKTKARSDVDGNRIGKLRQAHREGRTEGTSCKKLYGDLCPELDKKFTEEDDVIAATTSSEEEVTTATTKQYRSKDDEMQTPAKSKFKSKSKTKTSEYAKKFSKYYTDEKKIPSKKKYRVTFF